GSSQFDFNIDSVEHALFRYALLTIHCMNARMRERNRDVFERELFPARVETDCHGSADTETDQQVTVRVGSFIAAACADRFVTNQTMLTSSDFLLKAARISPHDYVRGLVVASCSHNQNQGRRIPANASRYRQMRKTNRIETTVAIGRPLGSIKM